MKIFVTTFDLRPETIRALAARGGDGIELRAEGQFADLAAIRAATSAPLLLTLRGERISHGQIEVAFEAGIDLVDVEWHEGADVAPFRERVVLSHHDYQGVPDDLDGLADAMLARGCAETKIAVTPQSFAGNERLLAVLRRRPGLTLFGMGERGLYSRILAPFLGSRLTFVAPDEAKVAAPGQISLEKGLAIYGAPLTLPTSGPAVFAIAGNPAGHSLSPTVHNPLFRARGANAAYTIASFERFDEIAAGFLRGEPRGLSVTAPFKEEAFRFALDHDADVRPNARAAEAINTLVWIGGRIVADNTDVDGFQAILPKDVRHAAIAGAGGTARAAIVALQSRGIPFSLYNRTPRTVLGHATRPLEGIEGDLIIDTLPGSVSVDFPNIRTIAAAYNRGGLSLFQEQAKRQNVLFLEALT
jgi:3-dehydroquinate dehydratase/shikimate dehydrogenase